MIRNRTVTTLLLASLFAAPSARASEPVGAPRASGGADSLAAPRASGGADSLAAPRASGGADSGSLLLDLPYELRANVPYTTGVLAVIGAPRATKRIRFAQLGSPYCSLVIDGVSYTTTNPGQLLPATLVGADATFEIPAGTVFGLSVLFHQTNWDSVQCHLQVFDDSSNVPAPEELLLGAIEYAGGFTQSAALNVNLPWPLGRLRFAVPAFCGPVEVLEAGTVVGDTYYRAASMSAPATFAVDALGARPVSQIRAALNGPAASRCSIPVYGAPAAQP